MKNEANIIDEVYSPPKLLIHKPIRFETSQSWNQGHGPVSNDPGNSDGDNYKLGPYEPKKTK